VELEFFASCLSGLEKALAGELKSFGIERVRPLGGGVAFFCGVEQAYRACLWSRLASRVMLVVGRVNAGDADLLYAGVYDLPWESVLAADATFAVRAHGSNDELRNTRFTALKVKDAIVDKMRVTKGDRPQVDTAAPRAAIDVRIRERRATVSLDFSGEALNHRTYLSPDDGEDAALACSLAAGALALSGWAEKAAAGGAFLDPACSDGILLVEAAAMACDCAPGLLRSRWGFFGWAEHDEAAFARLVEEADERFEAGLARVAGPQAATAARDARPDLARVRFAGASTSSPSISRARDHVRRAGLRQAVTVELADASTIAELQSRIQRVSKRSASGEPCHFTVCNLAANTRLDARAYVQSDEATFAAACTASALPATFAMLDPLDIQARFSAEPVLQAKVGKGRVENVLVVYDQLPAQATVVEVPDLAGGAPSRVEVFEPTSEQFAARLRKVFKERRKWAAREGVSNYRIYDADLNDYAVAIDVYTGAADARGNTYLHIAEYAPPASIDPGKARRRVSDVLALAPVVCGIRPDHVFSKTRLREKGGGQYRNAGSKPYVTHVEENGHLFEVDLAGRLDTGLFLDHRDTRMLVQQRCEGADFLNLFAYTGSASVYAAAGGAASTTTVDLSQTYLDWAQRNMAQNGFTGPEHVFEKADVMRWITDTRRSSRRFDFIFVDPPTFSNSKSMGKRTWDVQRDHVELLIGVSRLLKPEGEALFSCNLRSFKPYEADLEKYGVMVEDISAQTIPADFARTPKIHKCYLVRRA